MHLNIEQELFTFRCFDIRDGAGRVCYQAEGEYFTFVPTLHIYDTSAKECATVKQKLWNFFPTYEIYVGGKFVTTLQKQISFLCTSYDVPELSWNMEGEFLQHEYSIDAPWGRVASISRAWFTWGDCYDLDIPNPAHALTVLCLCLAVDLERGRTSHNN